LLTISGESNLLWAYERGPACARTH